MSSVNVTPLPLKSLPGPEAQLRLFERDLADLLTYRQQGHMEKWEYWDAGFPGDPAGGAQIWETLIRLPGAYYVPTADMAMISNAARSSSVDVVLRDINTVVELGPGSPESVSGKTLPFLKYAQKYIAVDQCIQHAENAALHIHRMMRIPTETIIGDYLHAHPMMAGRDKTAFFMWGAAIGNIPGRAGEDAVPKLVRSLTALADGCNPGDTVFIGLDTEARREMLTDAYNVPLLSRKFLSILHAGRKFGLVTGNFTPETWTHRSVWHDISHQCAHYLIAGEDQDFTIAGQHVQIPAGKPILTNNSYKFPPAIVEEAARMAGFSRVYISDDRPIALMMATR